MQESMFLMTLHGRMALAVQNVIRPRCSMCRRERAARLYNVKETFMQNFALAFTPEHSQMEMLLNLASILSLTRSLGTEDAQDIARRRRLE